MNKKIDKIIEEFYEEYRENHYKVCEGLKCVCRTVLGDFLKQKLTEFQDEIVGSAPVNCNRHECKDEHCRIRDDGYTAHVQEVKAWKESFNK